MNLECMWLCLWGRFIWIGMNGAASRRKIQHEYGRIEVVSKEKFNRHFHVKGRTLWKEMERRKGTGTILELGGGISSILEEETATRRKENSEHVKWGSSSAAPEKKLWRSRIWNFGFPGEGAQFAVDKRKEKVQPHLRKENVQPHHSGAKRGAWKVWLAGSREGLADHSRAWGLADHFGAWWLATVPLSMREIDWEVREINWERQSRILWESGERTNVRDWYTVGFGGSWYIVHTSRFLKEYSLSTTSFHQ